MKSLLTIVDDLEGVTSSYNYAVPKKDEKVNPF